MAAPIALALAVAACGGERRTESAAADSGAAAAPAPAGAPVSPAPDTAAAVTPDTSAQLPGKQDASTPAPAPGTAATGKPADTAGKQAAAEPPAAPKPAAKPAAPAAEAPAQPAQQPAPAPAAPTPAAPAPAAPAPQAQADAPLRDEYHQAPRDTVAQPVYDGWKQYNLNCARCHGEDVLGTTIAPHLVMSLKPDGPINTKEAFVQVTCAGRPDKGMPAWCALGLEMEKIDQIYSYVKGRSAGEIGPGRPAVKQGG
jgi:hypothetical protein